MKHIETLHFEEARSRSIFFASRLEEACRQRDLMLTLPAAGDPGYMDLRELRERLYLIGLARWMLEQALPRRKHPRFSRKLAQALMLRPNRRVLKYVRAWSAWDPRARQTHEIVRLTRAQRHLVIEVQTVMELGKALLCHARAEPGDVVARGVLARLKWLLVPTVLSEEEMEALSPPPLQGMGTPPAGPGGTG